ncbi:MAG: hypothetical protein ACRCVV_22080 [Shewanella sp.]
MPKKYYTLFSPTRIKRVKAKPFMLNLNTYRNSHYHTLNAMKIEYKSLMSQQINDLPVFTKPIMIKYVLMVNTNRLCDTHNVCSVVAKFFCDALTELGKIPDDNFLHIVEERMAFGGVHKTLKEPEVIIYIKEID